MILQLLGGLLILTACGKQINIDHSALENASKLSSQKDAYVTKNGSVVKSSDSTGGEIIYNGSRYTISAYSSLITKNFIKTLPKTNTVSVTFKGSLMNGEMVITEIKKL